MAGLYDDLTTLGQDVPDEEMPYWQRVSNSVGVQPQQPSDYRQRLLAQFGIPASTVFGQATTPAVGTPENPADADAPEITKHEGNVRGLVGFVPERDKPADPKYIDVTEERSKRMKDLQARTDLTPDQKAVEQQKIDQDTYVPNNTFETGGAPATLAGRYLNRSQQAEVEANRAAQPGAPANPPSLMETVNNRAEATHPQETVTSSPPESTMRPVGAEHPAGQSPSVSGLGLSFTGDIPLANPERVRELQGAIGDEAAARGTAGDIAANAQEGLGAANEQAGRQEMADLQQVQENMHRRQAYLEKIGDDIERDSRKLSNDEVDPEHWWHSRTTWQKVLTVISMALGGYVQARTGNSAAVNMIMGAIQADTSAQRANIENKWAGLRERHSILADKSREYGNMDVAEKQMVAAKLQAALQVAQASAQRATSPIERANAQALVAQLEQKAIEVGISTNKYIAAGYGLGAGTGRGIQKDLKPNQVVKMGDQLVYLDDVDDARKYKQMNAAAEEALQQTEELKALLADPRSNIPGTAERGRLNALGKLISVEDLKANFTGGRGGKTFLEYLNRALGGYGSLNPITRKQSAQALDTFQGALKNELGARNEYLRDNWVVERALDPATGRPGLKVVGQYSPQRAPKQDNSGFGEAGK